MDRVQNWGVDYSLLAEVLFDFSGRCYELYNEDHFLTELLVDRGFKTTIQKYIPFRRIPWKIK